MVPKGCLPLSEKYTFTWPFLLKMCKSIATIRSDVDKCHNLYADTGEVTQCKSLVTSNPALCMDCLMHGCHHLRKSSVHDHAIRVWQVGYFTIFPCLHAFNGGDLRLGLISTIYCELWCLLDRYRILTSTYIGLAEELETHSIIGTNREWFGMNSYCTSSWHGHFYS